MTAVQVLHSPKRVRVVLGGEVIADSRDVLLLRSDAFLPVYYFPEADLRPGCLEPVGDETQHELGGRTRHWTIAAGGRRAERAAWSFVAPDDPALASLAGRVAFDWRAMDAWYEEDEEVFVHPRDPQARIDVLQASCHVQVVLGGTVVADSRRPLLLFETRLPTRCYLPMADVRLDLLTFSPRPTRCPYKGIASYWSATVDGRTWPNIAWSYREPIAEMPRIKGLIAFYDEHVDAVLRDGVPSA